MCNFFSGAFSSVVEWEKWHLACMYTNLKSWTRSKNGRVNTNQMHVWL